MLRLPCSYSTHATRGADFAVVRLLGNGELITCSRVNDCCACAGILTTNNQKQNVHVNATTRTSGRDWFRIALLLIPWLLCGRFFQRNFRIRKWSGNLHEANRTLRPRAASGGAALCRQIGVFRKADAALEQKFGGRRRQPQTIQIEPAVAPRKSAVARGPSRTSSLPFADGQRSGNIPAAQLDLGQAQFALG